MVEENLVMTPDITLGDLLTTSPQYVILVIVIWTIWKLGPILLKLAVQIEKMNDIIERQEEKNADKRRNGQVK